MKQIATCLIGNSGLVGSNLLTQRNFTHTYRSTNIENIRGKSFDELICAGVSGFKWEVNRNPEADRERIKKLLSCLSEVRVGKFVLISTIDVYGDIKSERDESYSPIGDETHSYGKHRQEVETWVRKHFPNATILRLAGLYGHNLKKNLVYDLLHQNVLDMIDPQSVFQWYSLSRLTRDIDTAVKNRLSLANLFPEPLPTRQLIEDLFADRYQIVGSKVCPKGAPVIAPVANERFSMRYDLRTQYGKLFGGNERYIQNRAEVLSDLKDFVHQQTHIPQAMIKRQAA